ncbi:MAG TPA: RNA 3'-phosphate cyclase, partial [Euryarchaeota archaeon]|nr:RNA 3'-phosphate cyclase [Euryarchaeota archaeon]
HSGALPEHVAERQRAAAEKRLRSAGYDANIDVVTYSRSEVLCPGSGITLWTETMPIGASSLGSRGVVAEAVGKRAASYIIHQLDAGKPADLHFADQIIPYLALARGRSVIKATEATMHLVTNLWVVEQLLGVSTSVQREEGRSVVVEVEGAAFSVEED